MFFQRYCEEEPFCAGGSLYIADFNAGAMDDIYCHAADGSTEVAEATIRSPRVCTCFAGSKLKVLTPHFANTYSFVRMKRARNHLSSRFERHCFSVDFRVFSPNQMMELSDSNLMFRFRLIHKIFTIVM